MSTEELREEIDVDISKIINLGPDYREAVVNAIFAVAKSFAVSQVEQVLDRIENIDLPSWPEYHWESVADEIKIIRKEMEENGKA